MFTVRWLILLHRWVHVVVISFGVDRGVLVCYDQQLVEGSRLVAEESVLEEGALSAPGSEVLYGLNLVHPLAGVAELGPMREVVAG